MMSAAIMGVLLSPAAMQRSRRWPVRCAPQGMKIPFPPRKVLVAVDGSEPSFAALEAALSVAGRLGAALEAVYVEPVELITELDPPPWAVARERRALRAAIERRVGDDGVPLRLARGQAAAELARLAAPKTAQLLVVGTHGRQGSDRFLMGSTAEAVFHRARIPVLAVREGAHVEPRRILAPCNLQPYADDALLYAFRLAASLDARVTALYVAREDERVTEAARKLASHIERQLGTLAARRIDQRVRRGEARAEIAVEAARPGYGLVVLSGHHRAQLSDLALGTTAERLLRRCRVPMLVVPAREPAALRLAPA
jgi:nucleotide-binding universal stress UspA family protein